MNGVAVAVGTRVVVESVSAIVGLVDVNVSIGKGINDADGTKESGGFVVASAVVGVKVTVAIGDAVVPDNCVVVGDFDGKAVSNTGDFEGCNDGSTDTLFAAVGFRGMNTIRSEPPTNSRMAKAMHFTL